MLHMYSGNVRLMSVPNVFVLTRLHRSLNFQLASSTNIHQIKMTDVLSME